MKRILVANDLSAGAANALARAIRLASEDGAAIRVIHAADAPPAGLQHRIETEARIMAEELAAQPLTVSAAVSAAGAAAGAIVAEADAFDADLIVLGGHGEPRLRDAIFGTTATHVVRHAARPVLIVQGDACDPYGKTLVAIDDSRRAPDILAAAIDVAPAAELFAVHAFSPTFGQTLAGADEIARQEAREELELEKVIGALRDGAGQRSLTATRHAIVETGEALSVIMAETEKLVPDLVVMGTRNRASYLGSRAVDTVFWCPSDLLIVPDADLTELADA